MKVFKKVHEWHCSKSKHALNYWQTDPTILIYDGILEWGCSFRLCSHATVLEEIPSQAQFLCRPLVAFVLNRGLQR